MSALLKEKHHRIREIVRHFAEIVVKPVIDDYDEKISYVFSHDGKPGPISEKLYKKLRGIQYGDEPDTHSWVTVVE